MLFETNTTLAGPMRNFEMRLAFYSSRNSSLRWYINPLTRGLINPNFNSLDLTHALENEFQTGIEPGADLYRDPSVTTPEVLIVAVQQIVFGAQTAFLWKF